MFKPYTVYSKAKELMFSGNYSAAYEKLKTIKGFRDVDDLLAEIENTLEAAAAKGYAEQFRIGNSVKFGSYEQNNIDDGTEEIEWLVLDADEESGRALLLSKYALDARKFNDDNNSNSWEDSTLRTWLNDSFYMDAFSLEEQNRIVKTNVFSDTDTDRSADLGDDMTDKVFLLSISEAEKYFIDDETRTCSPSQYALGQKVWTGINPTKPGDISCRWWLRTPGSFSAELSAAYVASEGYIFSRGISVRDSCAVRPALWLDYSS